MITADIKTDVTRQEEIKELFFCEKYVYPQSNGEVSIPKGKLNKPTDALVNLMNQLNNFTDIKKKSELNFPKYKYRDEDYFKNLTKGFKRKALSFFHMNVCSLTKKFDDFNVLLSELNVSFEILAFTETRIKKDSSSPINLQLINYSIEHTETQLNRRLVQHFFI